MKQYLLAAFIILTFICSGCSAAGNVGGNGQEAKPPEEMAKKGENIHASDETVASDFVYRLVADKAEYPEYGDVTIYAELEYVGEQDEMVIYHAASPFYFSMMETTRGYPFWFVMDQPLVTTTLKKGEPLRGLYSGGGGYSSEDDADFVAFMKDFLENGFPSGHYRMNGSAQFYIMSETSDRDNKVDIVLESTIEFAVANN